MANVNKTEPSGSGQTVEQSGEQQSVSSWGSLAGSSAVPQPHSVSHLLVTGPKIVQQSKVPMKPVSVGVLGTHPPASQDNTNVLAKVLTSTTLDPARATMHQSQGTAVMSVHNKVHARTIVPVTGASALPAAPFTSPTASMLHGSLGGILSSVTQSTVTQSSIVRSSVGTAAPVATLTLGSIAGGSVTSVSRIPAVSVSSIPAALQAHVLPRGPAVVKPSLVISQPSIRVPVAHTTAILTQPRGISAARPVSVTPGLPASPAATELTRAAVPLKDTPMRMPVFTKSVALPIQVANASQMSSLANPTGTKPSIVTLPITGLAAVNKFPKATAPQPVAGNIVSGPLAVGRQQVAAPVGMRSQKIVFTPSSQTVSSATVVPLLRSVPAVVPLNLSQPPVRPQRNIVSVSPVTASAALPKAATPVSASAISISSTLMSSAAFNSKTQQIHKAKLPTSGQLVSVVMTNSVPQVHTANSFSMQLPPAHLGAVLPVHGGLVGVGQASMVTASMDNIPVPAAMVNSTMGMHSSAANRNADRSLMYSLNTTSDSLYSVVSADVYSQSRSFGSAVITPSTLRSATDMTGQPGAGVRNSALDFIPLTASEHKVDVPLSGSSSNGTLASPGAQRPSILRKRTAEGAGLVRKTAVLPGSQDPHISSSSEIVASPKGSSIIDPSRENSQSSTDTASSTESTPAKIKLEPVDMMDNSVDISSVAASPRKKPRKQLLNASEELKDTVQSDEEIRKFALRIRQLKEADSLAEEAARKESEEYIDEDGVHWITEKKQASVTLLSFYQCSWNSLSNHFQRYTDVKQKDERRPTVNELANQKGVQQRASGWKLYHLAAQLEDLVGMEQEVCGRLVSSGQEHLLAKRIRHGPVDDDISGSVHELTQGNVQRSKLLVEQLREARSCMLKVLDHLPRVTDIISKHHSKRSVKKKERI